MGPWLPAHLTDVSRHHFRTCRHMSIVPVMPLKQILERSWRALNLVVSRNKGKVQLQWNLESIWMSTAKWERAECLCRGFAVFLFFCPQPLIHLCQNRCFLHWLVTYTCVADHNAVPRQESLGERLQQEGVKWQIRSVFRAGTPQTLAGKLVEKQWYMWHILGTVDSDVTYFGHTLMAGISLTQPGITDRSNLPLEVWDFTMNRVRWAAECSITEVWSSLVLPRTFHTLVLLTVT